MNHVADQWEVEDMCVCEPVPDVWMLLPGDGWIRWGTVEGNPVLDSADFTARGAGMVVVACPVCAKVYWAASPE